MWLSHTPPFLPAVLTASLSVSPQRKSHWGPHGCPGRSPGSHRTCHNSLGTDCAPAAAGPHGMGCLWGGCCHWRYQTLMAFASSRCHSQIVSQSLECWRQQTPPNSLPRPCSPAPAPPPGPSNVYNHRSGIRLPRCCLVATLASTAASAPPVLLAELLPGEGESPLAPFSPASITGEKLLSECSDTEYSKCTRCESGHYQQSWTKERHCTPHDICEDNAGLVVKTQGNATHNTVCRCRDGMHCSDASCQTCVENQPCQHGFGFVAAKAVAQMSSPCEPCAEGTFSNVSSKTEPCHPWTSCEEKGLVVKVKGTNTSDVICESGKRSSLSVLIPITAAVVTCLVGVCIYCLVHAGPRRRVQKQQIEEGRGKPTETRQPTEDGEDMPHVQETLLKGQPVAQEDGKESRMSEQEML
uniref:TNFR-Cys domain-containing protein n=1 Tax=Calidris pygmaea TaxID=425635 RepID=A0A8C3PK01_9CHAR